MVGKTVADNMNKGGRPSISFSLLFVSNSGILSANHLSDHFGGFSALLHVSAIMVFMALGALWSRKVRCLLGLQNPAGIIVSITTCCLGSGSAVFPVL